VGERPDRTGAPLATADTRGMLDPGSLSQCAS
jgi:hypothetical protein